MLWDSTFTLRLKLILCDFCRGYIVFFFARWSKAFIYVSNGVWHQDCAGAHLIIKYKSIPELWNWFLLWTTVYVDHAYQSFGKLYVQTRLKQLFLNKHDKPGNVITKWLCKNKAVPKVVVQINCSLSAASIS